MEYVIWSHEHDQWWRPDSMGYTPNLHEAGRYTREEAYIPVLNDIHHNEIAILLQTAEKDGPPTFHPYLGEKT